MTAPNDLIEGRLAQLESRNRIQTGITSILVLIVCSGVFVGWSQSRPSSEPLRVRGLIVEDAKGEARILMGSPIAEPNAGGNPRTGIVINDAAGVERFGLGLQDSGRVVIGFDAPPGKGDDRNRERITLVADENGGAYIRFLDRTTSVPARLYLDEQNRVWLEFIGVPADEIIRRRIGLSGEEVVRSPR